MSGPPVRRVLGASVLGPIHRRDGMPNQDAMGWWGPDAHGSVVAAVADGHGSRKSFRSQVGAQLAVAVGIAVGQGVVAANSRHTGPTVPDLADMAEVIVGRWSAAVEAHLASMPLRETELAGIDGEDGWSAREAVEAEPVLAYGATLLLAVVVDSTAIFLQLGDGDIVAVAPSGRTSRPMPEDPRLFGNETTSLCMAGAAHQFRCSARSLDHDEVAVLILATDGLGNAYADESALAQVGADLLGRIKENGPDAVSGELDSYLREAAEHSGDDTTVVVVWLGAGGQAEHPPSWDRRLSWGEPVTWPPLRP